VTDHKPSRTAYGVATLRAAHQVIDAEPRILNDPIAMRLLEAETQDTIRRDPSRFRTRGSKALRSHVVVRSRWAEDRLAEAVRHGVGQYVILGAGLDTFAYRQPPWAHDLRIFEVDQPASQQAKRACLARAGIVIPANVTFVAVDFDVDSLKHSLVTNGLRADAPVFFSWLGVTMYLEETAIDDVLRVVSSLPHETEIVFTFATKEMAPVDGIGSVLAAMAAAVGEPWHMYFDPDELVARLKQIGFRAVQLPATEEIAAAYFAGRTDDLPSPRRRSIVAAIV
jgi:methyltransferase (TIGR00027 family)